MKLRMQANSVRLRLKRGEVEQVVKKGFLREEVTFGDGNQAIFHYALEASDTVSAPEAVLENNGIFIRVPTPAIRRWAETDQVGIDVLQASGTGAKLRILIEKDVACIDGPAEENIDTFPNPLTELDDRRVEA